MPIHYKFSYTLKNGFSGTLYKTYRLRQKAALNQAYRLLSARWEDCLEEVTVVHAIPDSEILNHVRKQAGLVV